MAQAQAQSPAARSAAFRTLLDRLSRQLPSYYSLNPAPTYAVLPIELWILNPSLKGLSVYDTPAPSELSPKPDERAYLILAFLIQTLDHITYLVKKTCITRQKYLDIKRMILVSHYPAMATRTQRLWQSPFATLASYRKANGEPCVDIGVLPGGVLEEWYDELRRKGEVGQMVDIVCGFIEGDKCLWRRGARGWRL